MSSYDQSLLGEAPRATRAQLQEGYSVDLLEQPPRRTPSVRNPPPPQTPLPAPVTAPLIAETGSREKLGSPAFVPAASKSRTSFWRTRNGVITVVIIVLVVIGAVVGGAVGGTVKKSSNNNVGTTGTNSSGSSLPSASASATAASQAIASGTTFRPGGISGTSTSSASSSVPTQNGQSTSREIIVS